MSDDHQDRLDFLYGRLNYERVGMPRVPTELRLGRMRRLLRRLGDPHKAFPVVHVAGTKGKGSTSAMIAAALTASGVRTGLFCSPHLHALEERFSIDGAAATPAELVGTDRPGAAHRRRPGPGARRQPPPGLDLLRDHDRDGPAPLRPPRRPGPSCWRSAWGGGSTRPTSCGPAVSVITNISFDHTKQLGSTLAAIAREKAGIIKRGRPTVSGETGDEAGAVIRQAALDRRSLMRKIGHDFRYDYLAPVPPLDRPTPGRVAVRTWATDWGTIDLPLLGEHQARNAAVALATLDVLAGQGLVVSRPDVETRVQSRSAGRLGWR